MKLLSRCLIGLSLAMTGFAAQAGDADFTLVNKTGYDIESVFVVPVKQKTWGADFLRGKVLHSGQSILIAFKPNNSLCMYDLRVHWVGYGEEEDTTWERMDLCTVNTIALRYNRKTNETFADVD